MNRPILAAFLFFLILCTGVLVCSYGRKEKIIDPPNKIEITTMQRFELWRDSVVKSKHKTPIKDYRNE